MNLEQFRKDINILKDKVITNPDLHFHKFLSEEYYDQKHEYDHLFPIDSLDRYNYWFSRCEDWLEYIYRCLQNQTQYQGDHMR